MHSRQRSRMGQGLYNSGLSSYISNYARPFLSSPLGGFATDLYKLALDVDSKTGGLLGKAQSAVFYPSKMLAKATIGNTNAGKDWIKFMEDNLMIQGLSNGYRQDALDEQQLHEDGAQMQALKRQRLDDSRAGQQVVPGSIQREVNSNNIMRQRTGQIFQQPQGLQQLWNQGMAAVPEIMSAGERLRQIHDSYARLSSN